MDSQFVKDSFSETEEQIARRKAIMRQVAEEEQAELAKRQEEMYKPAEPTPQEEAGQPFTMTEMSQQGIMPSKYAVTQRFGNYNPALYRGINQSMRNTGTDFATPTGTPLALPQGNWKIEQVANPNGWNQGYGGSIVAVNEDTGEKLRFSHLSRLNAIPGKRLRGGSVIGYSGATGNVTGAHLDLEYYDGKGNLADVLQTRYAKDIFGE